MKQDIQNLSTILQAFQKIDPEFPLQYAVCLCTIALNEGLCLTDLAEKTNMPLSTISRITAALSKEGSKRKDYGLVATKISETERRRKNIYLTDKGQRFLKNASGVLKRIKA